MTKGEGSRDSSGVPSKMTGGEWDPSLTLRMTVKGRSGFLSRLPACRQAGDLRMTEEFKEVANFPPEANG